MGASSSKSDSSSYQDVWGGMSGFLTDLYGKGQNVVEGFTPDTGYRDQAANAWQQQLNPQQNPYLDQMSARFGQNLGMANQASAGQASMLNQRGGSRHGVANSLNAQNYGDQMGSFLGGQYQADMGRQGQAIGQAPMFQGMGPEQQMMNMLSQYGGMIGGPHNVGASNSSSKSAGVSGL